MRPKTCSKLRINALIVNQAYVALEVDLEGPNTRPNRLEAIRGRLSEIEGLERICLLESRWYMVEGESSRADLCHGFFLD